MLDILNILFYVLGGTAIIALPFMVVNHVKYVRVSAANRSRVVPLPAKFPVKSVVFFAVPIILAIVIGETVTLYGRYEVLSFLRELSGDYKIYVNAQPTHQPQKIAAALKEVAPQWGHHSHATKMIPVEIQSDKGSLTLVLGRDSGYAQEYWVFFSSGSGAFIQGVTAELVDPEYTPSIQTPETFDTGSVLLFTRVDSVAPLEFSFVCIAKADVVVRRGYVWGLKPRFLGDLESPWDEILARGRNGAASLEAAT